MPNKTSLQTIQDELDRVRKYLNGLQEQLVRFAQIEAYKKPQTPSDFKYIKIKCQQCNKIMELGATITFADGDRKYVNTAGKLLGIFLKNHEKCDTERIVIVWE